VKQNAHTVFIADKMGSEKFCLRWNDFEKNISSAFKELRDDKDFFDVTLACEDEQIKGHKVILAACSPFFRNILRRNQHEHPLLYMKGVKYTDLQAVLNFMYHGEVNVAQEELNSFLSVAEDLRVKGLTQNTAEAKQPKRSEPAVVPRDNHREQPTLPRTPHPVPDQDIQEVVPIKSEPLPLVNQDRHHIQRQPQPQVYNTLPENQTVVTYQEETGYEDYGDYQDQMYTEEDISMDHNRTMQTGSAVKDCIENTNITSPDDLYLFCSKEVGETKWKCNICLQFKHGGRNQVRNHVESKHFPNQFQYNCEYCEKSCSTKKGLEVHISEKHRYTNTKNIQ